MSWHTPGVHKTGHQNVARPWSLDDTELSHYYYALSFPRPELNQILSVSIYKDALVSFQAQLPIRRSQPSVDVRISSSICDQPIGEVRHFDGFKIT